jgi:Fe-S-cluster-containing dehydrogenase component
MIITQFVMVIDQERCIGCDACSVACQLENNTQNYWIFVETQGGAQKDTPKGKYPNLEINFLPRLCNHCVDPPCKDSCPIGAIIKRNDGIVLIDKDICDGCKVCITACPYGVISFDNNNTAEKCNFCFHRIDQGLEPFCVICCEGQAMHFGNLNDTNSKVSKLISMKKTFKLKSEEGTNPSVFYCYPKPKEKL